MAGTSDRRARGLGRVGALALLTMTVSLLVTPAAGVASSGTTSPSGTRAHARDGGSARSPRQGEIDIVPASPTHISNCIPFGNNVDFGFTGFIYRDVPAFGLSPGDTISFDLGELNGQPTQRDILFAAANINPDPAVVVGGDVQTQGVKAVAWIRVVHDSQVPLHPRGDRVRGDYELTYTAQRPFQFPGGGLIIGFRHSPPATVADPGCEQDLVWTNSDDASGQFYARFCNKIDRSRTLLDRAGTCSGTASEIGGVILRPGTAVVTTSSPRTGRVLSRP